MNEMNYKAAQILRGSIHIDDISEDSFAGIIIPE